MLRALRATIALVAARSMMNATPTSGRKVTSDRSGQMASSARTSLAHRGNRYQVTSATTPISMAKA